MYNKLTVQNNGAKDHV